jgi:lipid II:glycine glycyltransferase (peptidoglycan interpeptide bridge formation enzyme)
VKIRPGVSREDIKIFYQLYLASMERNRAVAKYPFHWFEAIHEEMGKRQLSFFLFAELDRAPLAGVVLIGSPTSMHYFHNGSRYEFLKFCPNELLVHASLEKAIEQGHGIFDFMGSDPEDLSLIKFKEKWGGRSVDLHTFVKDVRPFRCKVWEFGKRFGNGRIGNQLLKIIRRRRGKIG